MASFADFRRIQEQQRKPATFGEFQQIQGQQRKPATFGEFQRLQEQQRKKPTTKPSTPKASAPKVTGIVPQTTNSVTQPVKTSPTPGTTSTKQDKSIQDMIKEMNAQRLAEQIASLQAAYERSLTDLDTTYGERKNVLGTTKNTYVTNLQNALQSNISQLESELSKIQPFYYDKRNEAAAASDVGALNFAQYMASRGVKGGAGGMPEIYRQSALQGRIGALDTAEAQDLSEVERTRSDIQREYEANLANVLNNYASDLKALEDYYLRSKSGLTTAYEQDKLAAEKGVGAEGLQALVNQMNADRTFGLQEGQLMGMYDGKPTLQMQQFQFDADFRNKQFAADQSYRNKQLSIDAAYKRGQLSLQQAQQAMAAAKFEYEKEQDRLNREFQERQFEYSKQNSSSYSAMKTMLDIDARTDLTSAQKYNLAKSMCLLK